MSQDPETPSGPLRTCPVCFGRAPLRDGRFVRHAMDKINGKYIACPWEGVPDPPGIFDLNSEVGQLTQRFDVMIAVGKRGRLMMSKP